MARAESDTQKGGWQRVACGRWVTEGDTVPSSEPQQLLPRTSFVAACRLRLLISSPKEMQTSLAPPDAPTAIFVTVKLSQTHILA